MIKFNLRLYYIDIEESLPYYLAVKFQDNPYIKQSVLYNCDAMGIPIISNENSRNKGYTFYAELKDSMTIPQDYQFMLQEIKCVEVPFLASLFTVSYKNNLEL